MKYCKTCQKWIPGEAKLCASCGGELTTDDALIDDAKERRRIQKEKALNAELERRKQFEEEKAGQKQNPVIAAIEQQRRDKYNKKVKLEGCGCVLIVFGIALGLTLIGIPFGAPLVLIGLIILIVGFCS